ncbi:MAG TPA: hypothetical protein VD999_00340 [Vitreimonas sp.]|nr:hypothetical protein [Vitreimonas sp.]
MKKISFKVNSDVFKAFTDKAKKLGYPKSKVLRQWLNEFSLTDSLSVTPQTNTADTTTYSFHLSDNEWRKLRTGAEKLNLSHTKLLQLLITDRVQRSSAHHSTTLLNSQKSSNAIEDLWKTGYLLEAVREGDRLLENLSPRDVITLVKTSLRMGNFSHTQELLTFIKEARVITSQSNYYPLYLAYRAAHLIRNTHDNETCQELLNQALTIAKVRRDRLSLGIIHRVIGEVNFYLGNTPVIIHNYLLSLEYLDPIEYPLDFLYTVLHLVRIYIGQKNWPLVNYYLQKADEILTENPNASFQSWYYLQLSRKQLQQNQPQQALYTIEKSIALSSAVNSQFDQTIAYREKAQILLSLNKNNEAEHYFEKSLTLDTFLRPIAYHRSEFNHLFMRVSKGDTMSLKELENLAHLRPDQLPVLLDFRKYMHVAAQYLFAPNASEKQKGEEGLKELHATSIYPGMAQAAQTVLLHHRLQPLV